MPRVVDSMTKASVMSQQGNGFTMFIGTAVADLEEDSRILKIQLEEQFPFTEGELQEVEMDYQAGEGGTVTGANYVRAEWLAFPTNSAFPPSIYRGEQIIALNYKDSDKYYWMSLGRDDRMRHVEKFRLSAANERKTVKELTDENTYFIEVDTESAKHIKLQTSMSDEEEFTYILKLDGESSTFSIADNMDREIGITSKADKVFMRNEAGACIDITGPNIMLSAPGDILNSAGRQLLSKAPLHTEEELDGGSGSGVRVFVNRSATHVADDTFSVSAPSIGLDGNVVVPSLIVKHLQVENMAHGTYKDQYDHAWHDKGSGTGGGGQNSIQSASMGENNRHCTANEEMVQCIQVLCEMIKCNCAYTGCPDKTDEAMALVRQAKMKYTKGL